MCPLLRFFFFFNDTATTEIYTLSLHDALPISAGHPCGPAGRGSSASSPGLAGEGGADPRPAGDRKSTRLNSSHGYISYAVFCLKKKKEKEIEHGKQERQGITSLEGVMRHVLFA